MNNFFCGLHYVVGLAECADTTLKLWEAHSAEESSNSSHIERLIRTSCKAFHHRGSQQCGSSVMFRSYLRKEGVYKIPLAQYVGNRFNIIFYDGAGVYYLRKHMEAFIEKVHGKEANRLLQAVLADLKNPANIAGCRALGLIDKLVTGPLWRKLQESSASVLQLSAVYTRVKAKFDMWSDNSYPLLKGGDILEDWCVHEDEVWQALIEPNEITDAMTQEILQILFCAFSKTTQRLLLDHLPGSMYNAVTDSSLIEETASVPTTNVAPERDFAVLDRMMREKPNANLVALESMILYSHNKSSIWLEKRTHEERESLFQAARTMAPVIREKFKRRRQEIERRQEESLIKKQEAIARRTAKLVREKEKLTKEIEKTGLWLSRADVEFGLERITKKSDKKAALKLQINFRHKVLCQSHHDNTVFKFSQNRKQHSADRLKQNLFQLLSDEELSMDDLELEDEDPVQCRPVQCPCREDILSQPELLVGLRIQHRFEVDGELSWFQGTVLKMNTTTKEFYVTYDGEDEPCWFSLLEDISAGDLLILQ